MNVPTGDYEVSCRAVQAKRDAGADVCLLDCREIDEYETVRIEGALLVPMSEIAERLEELEAYRENEVVVYCHHGQRSLHVAQWLTAQGFADVKSMAGGIDRWAVEIDPGMPRY